MNLLKVKEVYIETDSSYNNPVFVLEDGTRLIPEAIATGSCWVLCWKREPLQGKPPVEPSSIPAQADPSLISKN